MGFPVSPNKVRVNYFRVGEMIERVLVERERRGIKV